MTRKGFSHHLPFMKEIHRWPVDSPHKEPEIWNLWRFICCWSGQTAPQWVAMSVIRDAITPMWRHCIIELTTKTIMTLTLHVFTDCDSQLIIYRAVVVYGKWKKSPTQERFRFMKVLNVQINWCGKANLNPPNLMLFLHLNVVNMFVSIITTGEYIYIHRQL